MKRLKPSKNRPHSPGMYRAYVPAQNVDAFYQAFDIKRRRFIEPDKRVKIW
jgi:endothelin-converting enzyme/putative endopeptidase